MKILKKILFLFCLCIVPIRSFCACSLGYYLKSTSPDTTELRCANNAACTKTCLNDSNISCDSDDDCGEQGTCSDSCGDGTCRLRGVCSDNSLARQDVYGEYYCDTCEACPIGYACDGNEKTPCNPFLGEYSSSEIRNRCSGCRGGLIEFTVDVVDDTITVIGTNCTTGATSCEEGEYVIKLGDTKFGCIEENFSFNNQNIDACNLGGLWANYNGTYYSGDRPPDVLGCSICPIGYACSSGEKRKCDSGREYQDDTGQSECKSCDDRFYIKVSEGGIRTICDECRYEGFYGDDGFCIPCPPGYKCTGDGIKRECTGADYQDEIGQRDCKTCPAGSYVEDNNCITCPVGSVCPGNGGIAGCVAPNYQDLPGKSDCKTCPAGSYVEDNNCITCPVGYACPGNGERNACTDTDDETGGTFFQNQPGKSSCEICSARFTVVSNNDQDQPANIKCNSCGAGYCITPEDEVCHKCSRGYSCPATNSGVAMTCNTSFMAQEYGEEDENIKYGVYMCAMRTYTSEEGGAASCKSCLTGYTTACDTNSGDNCLNVKCYNSEAGIGCYDGGNVCRKQEAKMCISGNCNFTWPDGLTIGPIDLSKIQKRVRWSFPSISFPAFAIPL